MKGGKCVHILHIRSYSTEPESLSKMYKLMKEKKLSYQITKFITRFIFQIQKKKHHQKKMETILRSVRRV